MAGYFKLSDLGETDMTFDPQDPPPPPSRRRAVAEPSQREIEIERKRQLGERSRSGRTRTRRPKREDPEDYRDPGGYTQKGIHEGYPPIEGSPEELNGQTADDILYGGAAPSIPGVYAPGSSSGGYPQPPAPSPKPESGTMENILPLLAGVAILGFVFYFMMMKRRSEA